MKISTTAPLRISIFGGGSDLPIYFERHGGLCISMSINLRQHIEIEHDPTLNKTITQPVMGGNFEFYEAIFDEFQVYKGFVFKQKVDVPIQSGLGSSASAAVAIVASLAKIKGIKMTRAEIADKAWDIEVNKLKMYGGKQDQVAAAFGGFNTIYFERKGDNWSLLNKGFTVMPFSRFVANYWKERILLFDTGIRRTNPKIQEELKKLTDVQETSLKAIHETALEAMTNMHNMKIKPIAKLMRDSWEYKKQSNPLVTTDEIDNIYDTALKAGASAGKLLGSGGGGFMIFLVEPKKQEKLIKKLGKLIGVKHVDYDIDWSGVDCRLLPE